MATSQKPTVLFVHGSWHTPKHFQPVRDLFEAARYPTSCPPLPTMGGLPPIGLMEDAQRIRDELEWLIETEHREAIVVAHSAGGVVATQAVDAEFARGARAAKGLPGGVVHLVYMCALLLPPGASVALEHGGSLPDCVSVDVRITCPSQQEIITLNRCIISIPTGQWHAPYNRSRATILQRPFPRGTGPLDSRIMFVPSHQLSHSHHARRLYAPSGDISLLRERRGSAYQCSAHDGRESKGEHECHHPDGILHSWAFALFEPTTNCARPNQQIGSVGDDDIR
jgi:hypothetical protein